ncbi:MAG: hypothetical protein ACYDHP_00765 [Ferrimicrobium sp.]
MQPTASSTRPSLLSTGMVGLASQLGRPSVCGVGLELAPLFPNQGIERGAITLIEGGYGVGVYTVLGVLLAGVTQAGANVAVVGVGDLGAGALIHAGADVARLVEIDTSETSDAQVLPVVLDAFDVVVVSTRSVDARWRHIVARARKRRSALVVIERGSDPGPHQRLIATGGVTIKLVVERTVWTIDPIRTGTLVQRGSLHITVVRYGHHSAHEVVRAG